MNDPVQVLEGNREHVADQTTPRPVASFGLDVAATRMDVDRLPRATAEDPVDVEEGNLVSPQWCPVAPLAGDDVVWVASSLAPPARPISGAVGASEGNREHTSAVMAPKPITPSGGNVAATRPNLDAPAKATRERS